ncbi:Mn2+/Fe2+ transporter, NRAMP family protein [unidentified eubacterium SCB49]|nr:Mn2+/Fe2+ transporter, NRAMP family protein [unidentified eubacterium SCB49]
MKNPLKDIGPGTLVAAAFIGPGTVTVCTVAGVQYGFTLLWAMALSVIATIVLQEMAARLGIVTQKGLAETITSEISNKWLRGAAVLLVVSAILIGNAAYEAGNISGGALGLASVLPTSILELGSLNIPFIPLLIGIVAFCILYFGNYKTIERALVSLVIVMSLSFLIAAVLTQPSISEFLKGLLIPSIPDESLLLIVGLIGTTVVPYNLFLHASLVKERWKTVGDLKAARKDVYVSIVLGGLVSMGIIVCGAAIQQSEITNAADLAKGLEPLFGAYAKYFLSIGLFAAGITSAITAPLAAAYVASGCFGWEDAIKSAKFKAVWITILLIGVVFSSVGFKSIEVIQFAQFANGLLLPIVAIFLLWIVNKKSILGEYKNTKPQNILGFIIVITTIGLGLRGLLKVFGVI